MSGLTCTGIQIPTASSASCDSVNKLPRLPSSSNRFRNFSQSISDARSLRSVASSKPMAREPRQFPVFMVVEPRSELDESKASKDDISSSQEIPLVDTALTTSQQVKAIKINRSSKADQYAYLFAAIASTVGVTFLAAGAVYYRFAWQMEGVVPYAEMLGTLTLALGAAVGMEFWARWAHRALWHASLWNMHKSHHMPRDGPFELNDLFAIINAVPAIALMAYGFFNKGIIPGLCFGAGLGITVFGMAYMFIHDGLVHRRFPVGPIANVPYFQKVAAAHKLHHADKFNGVPYGLFLGPKEVDDVGGRTELEKLLHRRKNDRLR